MSLLRLAPRALPRAFARPAAAGALRSYFAGTQRPDNSELPDPRKAQRPRNPPLPPPPAARPLTAPQPWARCPRRS